MSSMSSLQTIEDSVDIHGFDVIPFFIRNMSIRNMRLKIGKSLETFKKYRKAEFQKNCCFNKIFDGTRKEIEKASIICLAKHEHPSIIVAYTCFFKKSHNFA